MKIAVLSPISWRTPPLHYGPWEQVASNIAEGLVSRGHSVTLFASGNSRTEGQLEWICPHALEEDRSLDPKVWECLHIAHAMEHASEFDIIHNNYDFLPLSYSRLIQTPMITTIHGFSSPRIHQVYKEYNSDNYYVSISNADRIPELSYTGTVYNGIKEDDFSFCPVPDDYLLFFGRIHRDKGPHEAIEIARRSGMKIILSGIIQDQEYFKKDVKPLLNDKDVQYTGSSGPEKRNLLLGHARALLHPIAFEEPFGLSVAEAMICGTPVIAYNRGSMEELIQSGKTGFLVKNSDEAVDAVSSLSSIKRQDCSLWSRSRFSRDAMVDSYIRLYQSILL